MSDEQDGVPAHHEARLRLIWEAVVFQAKLAVEGLRDIVLIPASIVAVIAGLVAGGDQPDVYFRRVQRFGRRSDAWLNVFGHNRRGPAADQLVRPIEERLLANARPGGPLGRGADRLNQFLDAVNRKPGENRPSDDGTP